ILLLMSKVGSKPHFLSLFSVLISLFHPFFPPDLQQFTLPEEEVNCGQQHCEQEWSANLGPVESDAVESIWDSINIITVQNQTESEDESNRESQSTSDYQPHSDVNPDSDNEKVDGVVSRIPPSRSKRGRGRPRKHTGESPDLKCDVCGKLLATAANLKRHQQNHHREERPRKETSGLPDLKCDVCGKCFTAARSLMRHRRNRHSDERPYMCDTCGQCFTLNCYLTRHMKRHTEERQHCCTECGKCFFHQENLENHMGKTHRSNLKKHMRIHTGEKPFWCKECGKCFGENGSLSKHMMTHTEEKPHRCNECGRCFGLKGNLTVHMRTHRVLACLCETRLKATTTKSLQYAIGCSKYN
uniref:Zinc finger protein 664 n=1 Tax=Oncorhynchus kisutch TaxID=8019 RepID=A0A8C7LDK2_ONCKI